MRGALRRTRWNLQVPPSLAVDRVHWKALLCVWHETLLTTRLEVESPGWRLERSGAPLPNLSKDQAGRATWQVLMRGTPFDHRRGRVAWQGLRRRRVQWYCPRAPTPEPSSKNGQRPKNRYSKKTERKSSSLPTAGLSFQLLWEGCRVGPGWSAFPCCACWSLWLAGPGALSILAAVPAFRAFFLVAFLGHPPENQLARGSPDHQAGGRITCSGKWAPTLGPSNIQWAPTQELVLPKRKVFLKL